MDEFRRTSLTVPSNFLPSSPNPNQLQRHMSLSEAERTHIFTTNNTSTEGQVLKLGSGHSRSVSHGGGAIGSTVGGSARIPLKSAMKGGHQRALSQGQIQEVPSRGSFSEPLIFKIMK